MVIHKLFIIIIILGGGYMFQKDPTCKECEHYVQHYRRAPRGFVEINCGHCIYPRVKSRAPDTLACVYFKPTAQENEAQKTEVC